MEQIRHNAMTEKTKYSFSRKQKLGEGTFADVYLGQAEPPFQKPFKVAIKRISKEKAKNNPKLQAFLRNEVSLLREFDHPNIVKFHDSVEDKRYLHLILEYCSGGDLFTYLRLHSPLSETIIHDMMLQLSKAICYLREHNVSHRDLKPQNILLSPDHAYESGFCVKITDFGFACRLAMTDMTKTFCGSPLHMAPEVLNNHHYDPSIDLWSLGTIAYQMATGAAPYRGKNLDELRMKQRSNVIPIPKHYSKDFCLLVNQLLTKDPKKRISFKSFYFHSFFRREITCEDKLSESLCVNSFIIVDRNAVEFVAHLDKLCAKTSCALTDDMEQMELRKSAEQSIRMASIVMRIAIGRPLWDQLLLYGRVLVLLRKTASQGKIYLQKQEQSQRKPCSKTIQVALRFKYCLEYCVGQVDVLRSQIHYNGNHSTRCIPDDLIVQKALECSEEAQKFEAHSKSMSKILLNVVLTLLTVALRGTITDQDKKKITQLMNSVEQRRCELNGETPLLQNASQEITTSQHSSLTIERSAPIDIPNPQRRRRCISSCTTTSSPGSIMARYCGSCGLRFMTLQEKFCPMCGVQRNFLTTMSSELES